MPEPVSPEPENPKPRSAARKRWRSIFRRSRVYIPFLVLVLLALAVCLPLSPPWLKGFVERRIAADVGLDVTIDKLRVHLLFGQMDLYGIALHSDLAEPPFRIDSVHLDGTLAELLAGDGHWPAHVRVARPSEVRVRQTPEGAIEPVGELATLIRAVERLGERPAPPRDPLDDPRPETPLLERYLPLIDVQNVRFAFEPYEERLPPLVVALDTVRIPERLGGGDRLLLEYRGTATSGTSESISGELTLLPEAESARATLLLSGIQGRFVLPELGPAAADARQIALEASAGRLANDTWQGSLKLTANRFELEETSLGGERWIERALEVSLEGVYHADAQHLENVRLTLDGEQLDVRLSGEARLDGDYEGSARLRVNRLPPAAIDIARREAAREVPGLRLDPSEIARVELDLSAQGPFARPMELDYEGSVEIAGWTVSHAEWPESLYVRQASGTLTRDGISLPDIAVQMAGLDGRGNATLPLPVEDETETQFAEFDFSLSGSPERSLGLLRHAGLLPSEINTATMPLTLNVSGRLPFRAKTEADDIPFDLERIEFAGTLSWERGQAFLRDLSEPIEVSSGSFRFSENGAQLRHLRVEYRGMELTIDMTAETETSFLFERPEFSIYLRGGGPIPAMLQLAEQIAPGLILPDDIIGNARVTARAFGTLDDLEALDYDITLNVAEGAGSIPLPDGPVSVSDLRADLRLRPHEIVISRFFVRVHDLAEVALTGLVTEEQIQVNFEADADLSVVPVVAGREVADLYFEGTGRGNGNAQLTPREPLDPGHDVLRRWIDAIAGPNPRLVDIAEDAPLRVTLDATLFPGENVSVFHRDFPQPARNLRGQARADETGFYFRNLTGDLGSTENIRINEARVALGIGGRLVRITFDADLPYLDANEWMTGWGVQPWAERPFTGPRVPRDRGPGAHLITQIDGTFRAERAKVFDNYGTEIDGRFFMDAYRNEDSTVEIHAERATVYDGTGAAILRLTFPDGGGPTRYHVAARVEDVQVQGFLTDLRQEPQEFTGNVTGAAELGGTIGDYSDWMGTGDFIITESQFIGEQALVLISRTIELGAEGRRAPTTITGSATMRDEAVYFPDMVLQNARVRMVADGKVGFDGRLDFIITVDLFTQRLSNIPLVGIVVDTLTQLKDSLISMRLNGTINEPRISPAPLQLDKLPFFEAGAQFFTAREQEGRERLRGVDLPMPRIGIPRIPGTRRPAPQQQPDGSEGTD